jgi:hypothetical protein
MARGRVAGPDRVAGGFPDPHRCRPAGDDDVAVAEPAERHRRHPVVVAERLPNRIARGSQMRTVHRASVRGTLQA